MYRIIKGRSIPQRIRGRPVVDDSELIDRAKEGLQTGKYKSRNHAAAELSKDARGASKDAKTKRLNRKFKMAITDITSR